MNADSSDPVARFQATLQPLHMCYQNYAVMRMSALRQIPPQGVYVNGDGVLLARMALLGRFYEVPEHLFISKRHIGQSSTILPVRLTQPRFRLTNPYGDLPCPDWWDPGKTRTVTFPEFRLLREYFLSVNRRPLALGRSFAAIFVAVLD